MLTDILKDAYTTALTRVSPERVVSRWISDSGGVEASAVVAIGKCAAGMIEGLPSKLRTNIFAVIPRGYPEPSTFAGLFFGGHPIPDDESLASGRELLTFVKRQKGRVLLLLSGGSSACVDAFDEELLDREMYFRLMTRLHRAGLSIDRLNAVRASVSKLKGGRLAENLQPGSLALICSDVDPETPQIVGSGPTFPAPPIALALEVLSGLEFDGAVALSRRIRDRVVARSEANVQNTVVADNLTLLGAAASSLTRNGIRSLIYPRQIVGDVELAAQSLLRLLPEQPLIIVAGGEPTVVLRGEGAGGRCSELVLHLAAGMKKEGRFGTLLIGSSDGVDGSSPAAGFVIDGALAAASVDAAEYRAALSVSNSYPLAARISEPIMMPATGNNLRDLYLLART